MKRKAPLPRQGGSTGDIKKDLSQGQLSGIGAVAMAYNAAEFGLEMLLYRGLDLSGFHWLEIVKALDRKIDFAKMGIDEYERRIVAVLKCPEYAFAELAKRSIGEFGVLKGYRDAVCPCPSVRCPHCNWTKDRIQGTNRPSPVI
jgi:hypothetical protein